MTREPGATMLDTQSAYEKGFKEGYDTGRGAAEQGADPGSGKPSGGLTRRAVRLVGSLILAFATGVLLSDQTYSGVCRVLPASWEEVANVTCAKEHLQVSQQEAESTIDEYLGKVSGAVPARAWELLAPQVQQEHASEQDFAEAFTDVLWYQRLGAIDEIDSPGTFNRYEVRFLAFTGPDPEHPNPDVNEYVQELQLTRSGTRTQISDISEADRLATHRWTYPFVYTATTEEWPKEMRGYGAPSTDAIAGGDPTLGHGGLLRPFCKVLAEDGTWIYTTLGWIPDEYISGGTRDLQGMGTCDPHHLTE